MIISKFKSTLDFYDVKEKPLKMNMLEVYPDYVIEEKLNDLMIRGGAFYAIWDPENNVWSRNERCVKRIVDRDVNKYYEEIKEEYSDKIIVKKLLRNNSTGKWAEFKNYLRNSPDSYQRLDEKVAFQDPSDAHIWVDYQGRKITRNDNISKCLPYSLQNYEPTAWNELLRSLLDEDERDKIEWAIGSIIAGDSKRIQKFLVLYGKQGSGKSTILNIVMKIFEGYYTTFKAENLVRSGDNFNLDFLSEDPLVAIDADTNLSRIESNVLINQIVSHEQLKVNEKFKNKYPSKPICMLMLGTNQEVRITDAKSGIIRRLIDVEFGDKQIPEDHYYELLDRIDTELGAIAGRCLRVYQELGRTYYSDYVPIRMMYRTDPFFNFMQEKIYEMMSEQRKTIEKEKKIGELKTVDGISAKTLWDNWKIYCDEAGITYTKKKYEIIDEASNYFKHYYKGQVRLSGSDIPVRNWFSGFIFEKFIKDDPTDNLTRRQKKLKSKVEVKKETWLKLDKTESSLDVILSECKAQYDTGNKDHPLKCGWDKVKTKLKDLDTTKTHWVKPPGSLITIDFDITDDTGEKNAELNIEAASKLPPTYAEFSNGGKGLHLQYWYDGDASQLSQTYDIGIEVKVFPEDTGLSLRRRVSKCNNLPIAHISSGLPLKENKHKVINYEGIKDEQHLRNKILQAVRKECRPYGEDPKTFTCMKYIRDTLKEVQDAGMSYDLRDLDSLIEGFAANSHNSKSDCMDIYYGLDLLWPKGATGPSGNIITEEHEDESPIVILDCEVIKNLTLVVYKELEPDGVAAVFKKDGPIKKCVRLYNPTISDIEHLVDHTRIVGHNVVKYDNYILYTKMLGWPPEAVAEVSQELIKGDNTDSNSIYKKFRDAKNISYTDTLDVASEKKSLKKIEIEMHIPHKEMEIDWSKPLPESEWERLAQYCENDVLATEAYFLSKKWQTDFKARKILAELTGMTVNDSTNNLVAQLIFGDDREPYNKFIYPDLAKEFPGYHYDAIPLKDNPNKFKVTSYYSKGKDDVVILGEGGRVYAEPGLYYNTITFDVASMHPTSIIVENGFGPYTQHYKDLFEARIAIKHKDYDKARTLFNGRLAPYLTSDEDADDLAYALKIALNSTYGMTAAGFQNRFKDPRNIDNWVAKRGALFMETLRREVQKRGGHVIHIKTDSIKLVEPSQELQNFVLEYGKKYGYTFEIENKFERVCLINDAVYIALRAKDDPDWLKECSKAQKKAESNDEQYIVPTRWTATGDRYKRKYVFKHLFSKEPLEFWDFCEPKNVKTSIYLDLNENLKDVSNEEKQKKKIETRIKKLKKDLLGASEIDKEKIRVELDDLPKDIEVLDELIKEGHSYQFVGKAGEFVPVKPGLGGGLLVKTNTNGSYDSVTGTKGFRWLESETVHEFENWKKYIDIRYFRKLCDEAIAEIEKYGDFSMLVQGDPDILPDDRVPDINDDPWKLPCGSEKYAYCSDCPEFSNDDNKFGYCCKLGYNIENQILGEEK